METRYIKITEYCDKEKLETSFIFDLNQEGMLHIETLEDNQYLIEDELSDLEMFRRWHYDLGINLEGIDAMRHMVERIKNMQKEINRLQKIAKMIS